MKICLLYTSPGRAQSDGVPQAPYVPNPSEHANLSSYQIAQRFVLQSETEVDLQRICDEDFDVFVNYLNNENIAKEAAKCVKRKEVAMIGLRDVDRGQVCEGVEKGALSNSTSKSGLEELVLFQKREDGDAERHNGGLQSDKFCVIAMDLGGTGMAFGPRRLHQEEDVSTTKEAAALLKATALSAFQALNSSSNYALSYASIILRLPSNPPSSLTPQILSINAVPPDFFPTAITTTTTSTPTPEEELVATCFPGAHTALFSALVSTALSTTPAHCERDAWCASRHDKIALMYDAMIAAIDVTAHRLSRIVGVYDYTGSVLDCCCGTGALAKFAVEKGLRDTSTFYGIDLSPGMTHAPAVEELYERPITIGALQRVMLSHGERAFDHVVCFGSFHLFSHADFIASLVQMFLVARKSVSFDVDDLSPTYISGSVGVTEKEKGSAWASFNHNNVKAAVAFGVPRGWTSVAWNERRFAYRSPLMGEDVWTHSFRFEREEAVE